MPQPISGNFLGFSRGVCVMSFEMQSQLAAATHRQLTHSTMNSRRGAEPLFLRCRSLA